MVVNTGVGYILPGVGEVGGQVDGDCAAEEECVCERHFDFFLVIATVSGIVLRAAWAACYRFRMLWCGLYGHSLKFS
jgi:hypothetical protein